MLNVVFCAMIAAGFAAALLLGRLELLSAAVLASGQDAVSQLLQLAGGLVVWSGVMNLALRCGAVEKLARLFSPLTGLLYPNLAAKSPQTMGLITASFTANLLGLSAAATPPALQAMRRLDAQNGGSETASRHMVTLAVFNCCSVAVLPSTVAVLRQQAGSQNAMEILPAVWLASAAALAAAMGARTLLLRRGKGR